MTRQVAAQIWHRGVYSEWPITTGQYRTGVVESDVLFLKTVKILVRRVNCRSAAERRGDVIQYEICMAPLHVQERQWRD